MAAIEYVFKVVPIGTGSAAWSVPGSSAIWSDSEAAAVRREAEFPAVTDGKPWIGVIDFGNFVPTPASLREFLVPLGERVRAGHHANFALFVAAPDEATREFVQYLSTAKDFPVFVAPSLDRLNEATPAGQLTPTERETLDVLARVGGTLTAADFAARTGVAVTAAGNRLINLSRRGYVHRIEQSGRAGDLFVDPRSVREHRPV